MNKASIGEQGGELSSAARRLVVVDQGGLGEQVRRATQRFGRGVEVTCVDSFFAAIGEVSCGQADVVLAPLRALQGIESSAADALHAVMPTAKVVVAASAEQEREADAALQAGFDSKLIEPWREADIANLVGEVALNPRSISWNPQELFVPEPLVEADDASMPEDQAGGESLGDVDLVEAILTGAGELRDMAMRIVASRSGIDGIAWAGDQEAAPAGNVVAPIEYRGQSYGVLHAPPPATTEDLSRWTGWLSRWLALNGQVDQLRDLSMRDGLTNAWNRRYFNRFLQRILDWAEKERSQVTLLVFDIDDFKIYNDRYGHAAGDEILLETARLMKSVVREHDVVARIGGDEFAVIFWDAHGRRRADSKHPQDVLAAARRFQKAICGHRFPKLLEETPGTLTISGGLASFPWDGRTPEDLLAKADEMALQSKRQGKNAITLGEGALRDSAGGV